MSKSAIDICQVTQVDDALVASFGQLIPQLTKNNPAPDAHLLQQIVASESSVIFIARDEDAFGRIVGTLTLAFYTTPTGTKAWIEDVVVDHSYRGRGIGKSLMEKAITTARQRDACMLLLTSNALREAANALYRKMGFTLRETNFYQLKL